MNVARADKPDLIASLSTLNPRRAAEVALYVDTYLDYCEAQTNIDKHGAIVFHPRTGSPINNPYLAIRDRAARQLERAKIVTGLLWATTQATALLPGGDLDGPGVVVYRYGSVQVFQFDDGSALAVDPDGSRSIVEWQPRTASYAYLDRFGARTGQILTA